MRQIGVLQILGAIVILGLAAAPASGGMFYQLDDGSAEDAIYGKSANDAIAVLFHKAEPDSIIGVKVYIYSDPTPFQLMIADAGPTVPLAGPVDPKLTLSVTPTVTGFTDYRRVSAWVNQHDPFFVIVKNVTAGEPKIGLDTDSAGEAYNTWTFEYEAGTWTRLSDLTGATQGAAMINVLSGRMGDVNRDGRIDTGDALYAVDYFLGKIPPNPEDKFLGDANKDGRLDTGDALLFIDIVLGRRSPESL